MPALPSHPGLSVALLVVVVAALLFVSSRLDRVLPRDGRLEAAVQRWVGSAQALIVVVGLLLAIEIVYRADAPTWRLLTIGVFLAALWAGRHALSDWGSGIVLRAEGTLKKGGHLTFGTSRGRIVSLGLRSAEVEAEDGRLLRLPYTVLGASALESTPDERATRSHTFTLVVAADSNPADVMERITAVALLCPWSSAWPDPSSRLLDRQGDRSRFEVTVHPQDAAYAPMVENAVRVALGG